VYNQHSCIAQFYIILTKHSPSYSASSTDSLTTLDKFSFLTCFTHTLLLHLTGIFDQHNAKQTKNGYKQTQLFTAISHTGLRSKVNSPCCSPKIFAYKWYFIYMPETLPV